MPRLEPVMTATLPVRSNGVFFIFCLAPELVHHPGRDEVANPESMAPPCKLQDGFRVRSLRDVPE